MLKFTDELVLSFTDLRDNLFKQRKKIGLSILIFASLCLFWRLQTPPVYSAKGIVKEGKLEKGDGFSLPKEILILADKSSNEDPLEIITSQPVMERVIHKLGLQAAVSSHQKRIGRLKRMARAIKMDFAHYYYRKVRKAPSSFIPKGYVVPDRYIFKDPQPELVCHHITYDDKIFTPLSIKVLNEKEYSVYDASKKLIGTGSFDSTFIFEKGAFTLSKGRAFNLNKRDFRLTLLPLEPIAEGLKKKLQIKREKSNSTLLILTHNCCNRELSAKLINTVMDEYKNYLKQDSEKKAASQLEYLHKRQMESAFELDKVIQNQKHFFLESLDEGSFVTSESEMEFLFKSQASLKEESNSHVTEMLKIDQFLQGKERDLQDILNDVKKDVSPPLKEFEKLDLEAAVDLYHNYVKNLSSLHLKIEKYDALMEKIESDSLSSLSSSIADPLLNDLFQKAQKLSQNLQDEKNYSSKERERMKEDANNLSLFLKEHLIKQKNYLIVEENLIKQQIDLLSKFTLKKHFEEYERINNSLQILADKTRSFPDKWIAEQKINYNSSLYEDMLYSIAKMIEGKNITSHLEYVNSGPFVYAYPPPLPNKPKILFFTFVGAFLGGFIAIIFFILQTIFRGPTASLANLRWTGSNVEVIQHQNSFPQAAAFFTSNEHSCIHLHSKTKTSFFSQIVSFFGEWKENILHIEFSENESNVNGESFYAFLKGKTPFPFLDKHANSHVTYIKIGTPFLWIKKEFIKAIETLKCDYDFVFIQTHGDPKNYAPFLTPTTGALCLVQEEFLPSLEPFFEPLNRTLFLLEKHPESFTKNLLSLKNLEPLLVLIENNLKKAVAKLNDKINFTRY